ncbi:MULTISPECIES: PQQ-dependent sugar dehydrogenase [unclassified Yoonia]|uniref:PQQ-dependent sugar dehydrogenase n=1 Tax=unclassified Yoonia TaxID=2629118 RepID=UPI002AFEEC58|nr:MULTISPECIES: PQQ-dependent sugar dehydrogenase [unclassified Yoonia]
MTKFTAFTTATAIMIAAPAFAQDYTHEVLADGLERPWAMEFLPNGDDILMTGRNGTFFLYEAATGEVSEISGAPDVSTAGQGGLLDIALAPDFATSNVIYMTWAGNVEGGTTTHLGRGTLDLAAGSVNDVETLFQVSPGVDSNAHYGSRIVIHDGHIYMGTGDRNNKEFGPEHVAQNIATENGSVLRLTLDGEAPADNPFVDIAGAAPAIWSYGHRNIQAMTVHPDTGEIWVAEHGEAGGDEINIVARGENYGWPLAAYGVDYRTGEQFAPTHQEDDGFIAPVYNWGPGREDNFPPSGMTFYDGDAFPDWQGHLLAGNLAHQYLGLFAVNGDEVSDPARLLEGEGHRIRDVAVGPNDGFIYVIGDGDSAPLMRIVPSEG